MALSTQFCFERKWAEVVSINCEGAILFSLSGIDFHNPDTYTKYSSITNRLIIRRLKVQSVPARSRGTKLKSALLRVRQHSLEFRKLSDSFPESNVKTDLIIKRCKNGSHYSSEFSVWVQIKCNHKQFLLFVARLTDKNK